MLCLLAVCEREEIETYSVPKEPAPPVQTITPVEQATEPAQTAVSGNLWVISPSGSPGLQPFKLPHSRGRWGLHSGKKTAERSCGGAISRYHGVVRLGIVLGQRLNGKGRLNGFGVTVMNDSAEIVEAGTEGDG